MTGLKLNIPSINLDTAESGAWVDYEKGIKFKIARANTPAYRGAVKRLHKQHKHQIDTETLSDERSDQIVADLMASYVLLDWEGLQNGEADFPYSKENAEALLGDEAYSELRNWIIAQANDMNNFRVKEIKKSKQLS